MKRSWVVILLICLCFAGCMKKQVVKPDLQQKPTKNATFWPFSNVQMKK